MLKRWRAEPAPAYGGGGSTAPAADRHRHRTRVIEPSRRHTPRLREIWIHRRLIGYFGFIFVERRYRRTWLGWLWIPLRPAVDIGGRVLFFGGFLSVSPGDRPYFMFFIVGSAAWQLVFVGSLWATRSVDINRMLFSRINLPRGTAVAAAIVPGLLDFLIYASIGLAGVAYYYVKTGRFYLTLGPTTVFAGLGLGLLCVWVFSIGLWLSPLAARARDVRFLLGYVFSFWYLVTPVIYPTSFLPMKYRPIAEYNPLTAPVEFVKYGLLGTSPPTHGSIISSLAALALVLVGGLYIFNRSEHAASARV
jgi:lipopolysaccharide transport system permease protein